MIQGLQTAGEYDIFVKTFYELVLAQFIEWEAMLDTGDIVGCIDKAPAIISLANTMEYLRGQSSVFLTIRPTWCNQKLLYEYETLINQKANTILSVIQQSSYKDIYKEKLTDYFVRFRTNG